MPASRRALSALAISLLVPAMAACGSAKPGYGDKTVDGLDGVKVSGAAGKAPTLKWNAEINYPKTTTVKKLIKGKGEAAPKGRGLMAKIYIGNATTKDKNWAYTSQSPDGEELPSQKPWNTILKGAHVGDRIEALVGSGKLLGSTGSPQMGIGNHDALVVVVDVLKLAADKTPHDVKSTELPKLVGPDAKPTGFDFTGIAKPAATDPLKRVILKKGTGAKVTSDQTVTVNYLGETYGAKKPFDESYTKQPASFALSQVVQGWGAGLTGVPVGSRVLLQIPPSLGYGAQAQSGIPANSTLYFVVDVQKAAATPQQ
ncbi:MAG: FKBP-type peptidyl-prolyl cis-trans isomerase [Nocardioides sp.]|nr:FKBP-type peptidyl-prolyl cis-trans isomerase [Nocardioides sp.]